MLDTVVNYVLPNLALFGGIYAVCKYVEHAVQGYIDNFDEYQKKLVDLKKKLKYT